MRDRGGQVDPATMRASLEQHLGSRQVGKVVYGSIIGLALIVALDSHPPEPGVMAIWLLGTAVAVGLAEVYSDIVGTETNTRRRVTRHDVGHIVEDAVAVGYGVAFPAVFFVIAALGLLEVGTAFSIAKWTGLGLIGFYGYWAARFARATPPGALGQGPVLGPVRARA